MRLTLLAFLLVLGTAGRAGAADDLILYGAGSLRAALDAVAADFTAAQGITVRTAYGPSGLMRERIEKGEPADLFASADMGHPLKLRAEGRAAQVVMFTRNALCGMAPPEVGLTADNFLDKLLDPAVKLGTSTPKADPSGDYTWAMFHNADTVRPGSFETLSTKAQQITGGSMGGTGGVDPIVAAFQGGQVNAFIGYCSGKAQRAKDLPQLGFVEAPASLIGAPEYGLAIMKDARPGADALAFAILSPEGQATLARFGFKPVGLTTPAGS